MFALVSCARDLQIQQNFPPHQDNITHALAFTTWCRAIYFFSLASVCSMFHGPLYSSYRKPYFLVFVSSAQGCFFLFSVQFLSWHTQYTFSNHHFLSRVTWWGDLMANNSPVWSIIHKIIYSSSRRAFLCLATNDGLLVLAIRCPRRCHAVLCVCACIVVLSPNSRTQQPAASVSRHICSHR